VVLAPFVAAAGLAAPACPAQAPYPPPAPIRPRYALRIVVERGLRTVRGQLDVRFTPDRPTDRLVFRLWPNGPRFAGTGTRLTTGVPTAGAVRLRVRRPGATTLVVVPPHPLASGETVAIRLPWTLRVGPDSHERISRWKGGIRLGSFFPLLAWDPRSGWATDPPPRIPGEASTSPTADFDVRVRTPRGLTIAASGAEVAPGHWRAGAVRDFALAAGRFRVATGTAEGPRPVRVRVLAAPPNGNAARAFLRLAQISLVQLARRYGPYPWSTYTVVVPPDLGRAGIEYPTLTYSGVAPNVQETIIQHETAHQWFYSLVGNNQGRDPWLDETLATWAQTRIAGQTLGNVHLPDLVRTHVGAPLSFWGLRTRLYLAAAYAGGVVALSSLRAPDAVDCALRQYVARDAYAIARPGDLLDELERLIPGAEERLRGFGIHR
jgi:hypothetical protein